MCDAAADGRVLSEVGTLRPGPDADRTRRRGGAGKRHQSGRRLFGLDAVCNDARLLRHADDARGGARRRDVERGVVRQSCRRQRQLRTRKADGCCPGQKQPHGAGSCERTCHWHGDQTRQGRIPMNDQRPTSFAEMALADLIDAFSSTDAVPGGGSAAALAGAVGVSLLIMVAGLPKTKTGAPEETADLAEASSRLHPLRDALVDLVDRDSEAYRQVLTAFRLPRVSDSEKAARTEAID